MRQLFYLGIVLFLLSCTKKEIENIQADSFRVSILPANNVAFNQNQFSSSLDVRQSSGTIEYGLVAGKTINPTIDHDNVFKVGTANSSTDFTQVLSNLDTGVVFYVRAYGKSATAIQYSANQVISKLSPALTIGNNTLQYGQTCYIGTNFVAPASLNTPVLRLNNTPITQVTFTTTNNSFAISFVPPSTLPPGKYTLSVDIGGVSVVYPRQITLLEGTWTTLSSLLPINYSSYSIPDRFVIGDWIYTSQAPGFVPSLSKYNYQTGVTQNLTSLTLAKITQGATIVQIGNDVHWLCGELIGTGSPSRPVTNSYMIYHTTTDTWSQETTFPGNGRRDGVVMQAGNNLYYGLGWNPSVIVGTTYTYYNDFWVYDLVNKNWQQLPDYPGTGKAGRASFTIGGKLYVVCGDSGHSSAVKETWCYDPGTNQWSRKADYPGSGWMNMLTFSIGGFGYTGMGETSTYNSYYGRNIFPDIYKYDSAADKWSVVSNFGGNLIQPVVGNLGSSILVAVGVDANTNPSRLIRYFTP
jgi:hypothetical protein